MSNLEQVITWLEAGRQIGKSASIEQGGSSIWWMVGVQKWQGAYKLYIDKIDESQPVDYDAENEEITQVDNLDSLARIVGMKSPFTIEELAPLKGRKIFNPQF